MPPRILIVDDEPHIRDVICFAVEKAGMACTTARNGTEAMMAFRRGNVDLAVLDIGMPEMDGLDVCRQIRKTSSLPILFLSARDEEIDRVLGLEIGADDYVTKPFSPRELVARIKAILKRTGNARHPRQRAHGRWHQPRSHWSKCQFRRQCNSAHGAGILDSRNPTHPPRYGLQPRTIDGSLLWHRHLCRRSHHRQPSAHRANIRAQFSTARGTDVIVTVHGVGFKLGTEPGNKT